MEVEALVTALESEDHRERLEAAIALAKLNDPRAVRPLVALIRDDCREAHKQSQAVGDYEGSREREEARWGALDEDRSVYLVSLSGGAREAEKRAEQHAAELASTLAEMSAPEASDALVDLLKASCIQNQVIRLVGRPGDTRAVEPLLGLLRDAVEYQDTKLAERILHSLEAIGRAEPIVLTLRDPQPTLLRWYLAQLLGDIGDSGSTEILEAMSQDSDEGVRDAAAFALEQIKARER